MKQALLVVACIGGGVAGGWIAQSVRTPPARRAAREPSTRPDPALERRLEALERKVDRALRMRVDAARENGADEPAPGPSPADVADAPARPPGPAGDGAAKIKLADLLGEVTQGPFDQRKVNGMWAWMTQHQKSIPELIKGLEAQVKKNPNAELFTALATAYVGELNYLTTPGAPQGLVWAKASRAYDKAVELDGEHWQARFGKAFGTTFIPTQFGSRPAAIKQFEALREIQERRAPEAQYAQTYTQLGRLYAAEGNHEKAREVWRAGLELFPQNTSLKGQLEVSEKK